MSTFFLLALCTELPCPEHRALQMLPLGKSLNSGMALKLGREITVLVGSCTSLSAF